MSEMLKLAEQAVSRAKELGADQVTANVSSGSHVTIQRRSGKVEQATEATTRGLVVSVLCEGRYTSNSTSDLRPDALDAFLKRCVSAASYLEEDRDRALPDPEQCGRGVSESDLDQDDETWRHMTADARSDNAQALEQAIQDLHGDDVISSASYTADGRSTTIRVNSDGFSDESTGAWFVAGGEMTLREDERRPESAAYYAARHHADLPPSDEIAAEVVRRTRERLGSKPAASGKYTMLLENRAGGRILGVLAGAMSGGALHQGRSFLAGKKGESIGSKLLNLVDDPTLPRGLGSRPWDGDGLRSHTRVVVEEGVLRQYNIDVYHGRKLSMKPTSGSRSNWTLPKGTRPWQEIAADHEQAILVTGFLGGNANPTTGDFSYGIRGLLLENGEISHSVAEMNVSGNALQIFHQLVELADDTWSFSACQTPTMVFEDVVFSGT